LYFHCRRFSPTENDETNLQLELYHFSQGFPSVGGIQMSVAKVQQFLHNSLFTMIHVVGKPHLANLLGQIA
jgi:uncharacterized protein YpmS